MSSIDKAKDWWQEASRRDQLMVMVCGLVVVLYILFMLVLKPLYDNKDVQLRTVQSSEQALAKTKSLAAQLKGSSTNGQRVKPIVQIVDESLREYGLRLSNMQPNGKTDVRVRIDQVPFDKLVPWVHHIEISEGIQIRDMEVSSGQQEGYVSVTLRLHQSS